MMGMVVKGILNKQGLYFYTKPMRQEHENNWLRYHKTWSGTDFKIYFKIIYLTAILTKSLKFWLTDLIMVYYLKSGNIRHE